MANITNGIRPGSYRIVNPKTQHEYFPSSADVWSDTVMEDYGRKRGTKKSTTTRRAPLKKFEMDNSDMRIKYNWKKELSTALLVLGLLVGVGFYAAS